MRVKVYEGLKADRFTYIDTNMSYLERYVIKSKWKLVEGDIHTSNYPPMYGASKVSPQHMSNARYWYVNANTNNNIETRFWDGLSTKALPYTEIAEIVDTPHGFSINGENYNYERLSGDIQETIEIFQFEGHKAVPRYHTCNYFIIEDNGSEVLHLVPCLTEENEACLVDLITCKLYKNQGSGAFSVEGECLYEFEIPSISRLMRKPNVVVKLREQLVGNGAITNFIGTQEVINGSLEYIPIYESAGTIHEIGSIGFSSANHESYRIFWVTYGGAAKLFIDHHRLNEGVRTSERNMIELAQGEKAHIEFLDGSVFVNGNSTPITSRNIDLSYLHPDVLFKNTKSSVGKVIINNHTFHPCDILLHPTLLPQSAMIDLRTGDLYTNQGTGNFTCEGEDLGIWADTMVQEIHGKQIAIQKINNAPKVIWERTQPWTEYDDGSAKLLRPIFANENIGNKAQKIGRFGTANKVLYKQNLPWFDTKLPSRKDFEVLPLAYSGTTTIYNHETGGFRFVSQDYRAWSQVNSNFKINLDAGKYIIQAWSKIVDDKVSTVIYEGIRIYNNSGKELLQLTQRTTALQEGLLELTEPQDIYIMFKTGLNYEGYLAIKKIE